LLFKRRAVLAQLKVFRFNLLPACRAEYPQVSRPKILGTVEIKVKLRLTAEI
jgi:hypothetical protein